MSDKKCFILEYKCKKATPGRHIVVAYNADDAFEQENARS